MRHVLFPTHYVHRVTDLSLERLTTWKIATLLLDADCTLKRYTSEFPEMDISLWLETLHRAGIGMALVSNGLGQRIERFADRLKIPFTARALKPLSCGVRRAIKENCFDPKTTAMVGDQLFTDIPAGNIAGIQTILVDPIHPEEEHWFTKIKRPAEQQLKRFLKCESDKGNGVD